MKKLKLSFITILIVMTCFIAAGITSIIILRNNIEKNNEEMNTMLSEKLYEDISHDMEIPLQSAKAIATSTLVKDKIRNIESPDKSMITYLKGVKQSGNYETAFIATNKNIYYSDSRATLFNSSNSNYSWFESFMNSNDNDTLRINYDNNNEFIKTVFLETKIYDTDNTILGIAGIGISTVTFENIIKEYEEAYNVDILLFDKTNGTELSASNNELENMYFENSEDDDPEYKTYSDGSTSVTKDFQDLNWTLIILNDGKAAHKALWDALIGESVIFAVMLVVVILASVYILSSHSKIANALVTKTRSEDKLKRQSTMDKLTGLYNRRAYEEFIEKLEPTSKTYITVFDVDGLKTMNDTIGHKAGDEAIKAASTAIRTSFKKSSSFRTGGDEFVTFTEADEETFNSYLRHFHWAIVKYNGNFIDRLHVSSGSAKFADYSNLSIKQVIAIADDKMYSSKQQYYEELENQKPSYLKKI